MLPPFPLPAPTSTCERPGPPSVAQRQDAAPAWLLLVPQCWAHPDRSIMILGLGALCDVAVRVRQVEDLQVQTLDIQVRDSHLTGACPPPPPHPWPCSFPHALSDAWS